MDGREIALATLHQQAVPFPCLTFGWVTHSAYLSRVAGRDYWADREGVFVEFVRRSGATLVPQWYFPGEAQRRLEQGEVMYAPREHEAHGFASPDDVERAIDALPDDESVERDFDVEQAAADYASAIGAHAELLGPGVLVIDSFGQADFMGGYRRWGYENYLAALALYPEALRRYYHHTALLGRLRNRAIVLACERHGIAPFVYSGQDICSAAGPIVSPAALRELYFPELRWCLEPLVEAGVGIVWHCDGNICPILDDLLDLGVAGLQGFEEEHGVDYAEMARLVSRQGKPMILWGCVSVTTTLPHGTPDDVRAAVERSFRLAGPGRGHVLSPTSSILPETPVENIDALFQHGLRFGREFLSR